MTLPITISFGSSALLLAVVGFGLICLVFYALRSKGDVRAIVSHGKTVIELEAKERKLKHIRED